MSQQSIQEPLKRLHSDNREDFRFKFNIHFAGYRERINPGDKITELKTF